jgi:hypothetical protein
MSPTSPYDYPFDDYPFDDDDPDAEFRIEEGETSEDIFDLDRQACARSRQALEAASLDDLVENPERRSDYNLRWVVVHMIEETARHSGHGRLIRQIHRVWFYETLVIRIPKVHGVFVGPCVENDSFLLRQRLVDEDRNVVKGAVPERRHRPRVAIGEDRSKLIFGGDPHVVRSNRRGGLVEVHLRGGGYDRHRDSVTGLDRNDLAQHPSRHVFCGGDLLRRECLRVMVDFEADSVLTQIRFQPFLTRHFRSPP